MKNELMSQKRINEICSPARDLQSREFLNPNSIPTLQSQSMNYQPWLAWIYSNLLNGNMGHFQTQPVFGNNSFTPNQTGFQSTVGVNNSQNKWMEDFMAWYSRLSQLYSNSAQQPKPEEIMPIPIPSFPPAEQPGTTAIFSNMSNFQNLIYTKMLLEAGMKRVAENQ